MSFLAALMKFEEEKDTPQLRCANRVKVAKHTQGDFTQFLQPPTGAQKFICSSNWWLIHFADRDPLELSAPGATHAELMEWHPNAIAAEPFEPVTTRPDAPLRAPEVAKLTLWLQSVGETDPRTVGDVVQQCQNDESARRYFLGLAGSAATPIQDDRVTCHECALLRGTRCVAAIKGKILGAGAVYYPVGDIPRRCEGFEPRPTIEDRRTGAQRWPSLTVHGDTNE